MTVIIKRILVALYLTKMSRSEKVTQGNATHTAITTSAFFPPAETALLAPALLTATNNLADADAETETGSHESFQAANVAELQFDMALRNVAYYVQQKADANPAQAAEIIVAAALKMKKASVKTIAPSPVLDFRAMITGRGTAIKLVITSGNPYGTRYEIDMTTTPDVEGSWVSIADITAKKFTKEDLENGTRYYFRVRAINNIGRSMYSDVVTQVAA